MTNLDRTPATRTCSCGTARLADRPRRGALPPAWRPAARRRGREPVPADPRARAAAGRRPARRRRRALAGRCARGDRSRRRGARPDEWLGDGPGARRARAATSSTWSGGSSRRAPSRRRRSVPAAELGQRPFAYALLRVVRASSAASVNAGVVLFCRETTTSRARRGRRGPPARARPRSRPGPVRTHLEALVGSPRATRTRARSPRWIRRSASAGSSRRRGR